MKTFVTCEADLQSWDGNSDISVRNDITLSTTFIPISVINNITFEGNGFILTVDTVHSVPWAGFFYVITAGLTVTINNATIIFSNPITLVAGGILFNTAQTTQIYKLLSKNCMMKMYPVFIFYVF